MVFIWSPHTFFGDLGQEWLSDLQQFLHVGLPKLLFIAAGAWGLILAVNFVTAKIIQVAEQRKRLAAVRTGQVRTVASVVRATGITIVVFLAVLQIMENVLHFDLAPLLASAGVAGIALGLAAQTIVKDMLNGILILVEDQYTVGDVVTLAGMSGIVTSMTLRKTTLQGFDGTTYVIPNSQITNVANQSREIISSSVSVSVDFSASPDEVIPLLSAIAMEVRNEPAYRQVFMEDPKVLGIDSIKGSEVIYLIQVKTQARQQFEALREMQRRIRLALEAHRMLPGSPYRVLQHPGQAGAALAGETAGAMAAVDPTMAKPNEVNPFSGQ
ncbi:MAG TPA: mechanosensitive ion channel domain-containing protein [Acidobacteriaceae bacterium]|nr:mechanosensitive ion channel domain-containing protein [Acidobacteriaceae bacterium]